MDRFIDDLQQSLAEVKQQRKEGTIDAVVVGGEYVDRGVNKKEYLGSIQLFSKEVKNVFGFEPVIITGPKTIGGTFSIIIIDVSTS